MMTLLFAALQDTDTTSQGGGAIAAIAGGVGGLIGLAIALVMIIGMWKIFEKAGKPGWAAIVPIYNIIILLEIVRKPIWWIVLFFIPCANFVALILICIELAKVFGKSTGFAVLLILGIGFPILGFSDARYQPAAAA
jgi:hypothetical protein